MTAKMHADQADTDVALVRRLVAEQFPQWSQLPIRAVDSHGTDHDIYRLGAEFAVRMPRMAGGVGQTAQEARWLPFMAPQLPLAVPVQRAAGAPDHGYPFAWTVYEWLPGRHAQEGRLDLDTAAIDLAAFIRALQTIPTADAPPVRPEGRGGLLAVHDDAVHRAVTELGDRADAAAILRAWEESLAVGPWDASPVWIHGDLLPGNLLKLDGRLSAVIDFATLGLGDPATDLLPAWNLFDQDSRRRFRTELAVDDASWLRGRGWALLQAVVALPYYWDTNPGMVGQATRALEHVLAG